MAHADKIVLIDGHSLAYRAFNALPLDMRNSRGELTNAVFGFASMLLTVWRDEKPDYIAVAFDVGRTFRHDVYPLYKANRADQPDDFGPQMDRIQQIIQAFNLPIFTVGGFEADDVLGALARQANEAGVQVVIVTGDRDALQLVNERTRVLTSGRRFSDTIVFDVERVKERYGVYPQQLVDYKGLVGDVSDNIPGVRGVGEKTAAELLQKYGTIEQIYEHLDEVKSKRAREALASQREVAILSRDLSRIIVDVPVELDIDCCRTGNFDRQKLVVLFRELEFRTLIDRLPQSTRGPSPSLPPPGQLGLFTEASSVQAEGIPVLEESATLAPPAIVEPLQGTKKPDGAYCAVTTIAELHDMARIVAETGRFAFDVETTGEDPWSSACVGLSISPRAGEGYYVPLGHVTGQTQLPVAEVIDALGPLFADPAVARYAHNAKYDRAVLERLGMDVGPLAFDTLLGEWLLNPASYNLALKNLIWARLGVEMTPIADLIGTGRQAITMAEAPIEKAAQYAGADADMTLRMVPSIERELKEKSLWSLFCEIEMPLIDVLMGMERCGVLLDADFLRQMSVELRGRLNQLEQDIQQMVGHAFNIASTEQLSDALFITLGLPKVGLRKTKSGRYSTAADVLDYLKGKHLVIDLILEHRQLTKLKSTYIDAFPALVNPRTGRLHTSFNQTGTVTGRLSSSEPNLQNIPIRTDLGRQIRRAFIAPPGSQLLAADYSQIELRILAHVTQDPAMVQAFLDGKDIHASTASAIFGVPLEEVTSDMRRVAKTTNFAISYGVTGFGLAQSTGLSQEEAREFIASYFVQYPGVLKYVEETKDKAANDGYVETLLGRRRFFPELQGGRRLAYNVRSSVERMAINAPIQGSAADIIKIAMIRLDAALREKGMRSRMVLQVHDELILEAPEDEIEEAAATICETMEGAFTLRVPLRVDISVGPNWLDMEGAIVHR